MNKDDDTFFEDDEEDFEDTTFPDEDIVDEEEYEEDISELEEVRSYEPSIGRLATLLKDPWPPVVFFITVIGLGLVLLTPPAIWNPHRYFILADYFLIVFGSVAIILSLMTWSRAGTHRLRWAGPTNIIVVIASVALGIIDSLSWMLNSVGLFPTIETPILPLCFMLVIFTMYTLWLVQRSLDPDRK
ncbi:hypothetical protein EU527_09095 [Candidatus Thorarchaeota archaeon]|nr:MAG: hypothetical protein EU527_09095 [Candidatus Thorarchaeota archaeon]